MLSFKLESSVSPDRPVWLELTFDGLGAGRVTRRVRAFLGLRA